MPLLLREGSIVAAGLMRDTITGENLTKTLGVPLWVTCDAGRFTAPRRDASLGKLIRSVDRWPAFRIPVNGHSCPCGHYKISSISA